RERTEFCGYVFERRDIVFSQVPIQNLALFVVNHFFEKRLPEAKNRASFQLQLAQARVYHAPSEDVRVQLETADLAGVLVYLHFAGDCSWAQLTRADALSCFQIQTAAGAEGTAPYKIALVAAQHNLPVAQ